MIFVTVGTNEAPFDRLVRAVDGIGGDEPVVCQYGSSSERPARASCVEFLPFEEIVDHVRRARVVVTHAGVGSMLVAFACAKVPIVVPRLRAHGEAVDDHQLVLAKRLAAQGAVRLLEEPALLGRELESAGEAAAPPPLGRSTRLADEVGDYVARLLGRPRRAAQAPAPLSSP
jgi:UDP-N-acetylglucosamine transferase subunit ALG13